MTLAALFVGLMVFGIERLIVQMPLLHDGWGPRAKFLIIRGVPSLLLSAYMAWGLVMSGFDDSLQAIAIRNAATQADKDGTKLSANPQLQKQIEAATAQVTTLTKQNTTVQAKSAANWAAWHEDMVICQTPGRYHDQGLTCHGDIPGPGNISDPLKAIAANYDNTVLRPTLTANGKELARLRSEIATDKAKQSAPGDAARTGSLAETGLAAKTRALWTLLGQNPFLWLLPLLLMSLDMSVALAKSFGPVTGFDHRARAEAWAAAKQTASRDGDPSWAASFIQVNADDASAYAEEHGADAAELKASAIARKAAAGASGVGSAGSGRGPGKRIALTAVPIVLVLALGAYLIQGQTGHKHTQHTASPSASVSASPAPVAAGKPITVAVSPSRALTLNVAGVGTLAAVKGTFSRVGTMTVTPARALPPSASGVITSSPGFDVSFRGTSLTRPVTLSFPVPKRPAGSVMPVVAHRADNGTWDYLPVTIANGTATVSTQRFSLNLFGWIDDLGRFLGNGLAHWLAGRTPPLTCSGAPKWFTFNVQHSDLVHVCAKDAGPDGNGVDRAEIQIKSNRGVSVEVTVPGNPQYVYVNDQPYELRRATMALFGKDANKTVILPAGVTMTAGYVRTADTENLTATVAGYPGLAMLDTVIRQVLNFAAGWVDPTFVAYTLLNCSLGFNPAAITTTAVFSGKSFSQFLGCMLSSVTGGLKNGDDALHFASKFSSSRISVSALKSYATKLNALGLTVSIVLPALQSVVGNLWDAVRNWTSSGSNNKVGFQVDAVPAAAGPTAGAGPTAAAGPTSPPAGPTSGPTSQSNTTAAPAKPPVTTTEPESTPPTAGTTSPPAQPVQDHDFFSNYGPTTDGIAMCRGNQGRPESVPGGTVTQTFTANATGTISAAKVQVDPDPTVTATATLSVNGSDRVTSSGTAIGDNVFSFGSVPVHAGDTISVRITFSATFGKIITVYKLGQPGGTLTVSNPCGNPGMQSFTTAAGLRAIVSGAA